MLLPCILFFVFFVYYFLKYFPSKKVIDDAIKSNFFKKEPNNNVIILEKLGYYNLNINEIRFCFIFECINYLLYCDNPNYTHNHFLNDCCDLDEKQIENFCDNFKNLCISRHKNKMDLTINEIKAFIIKSNIYKKLDRELYYKFKRAIILSKFVNEIETEKLINALTIDELNLLSG